GTDEQPGPCDARAAASEPRRAEAAAAGPAEAGTAEAGTAEAGPAGTQILPPIRDSESPGGHPTKATPSGAAEPPVPPKWSARAQVPSRQFEEQAVDWSELEPPRRRVLVPVLIVLCILLIAALIGLGLWLALRQPP